MSEDISVTKVEEESLLSAEPNEASDDAVDEEDDEIPQDGDVLEPGCHLIELATAIPCRRDVLHGGLDRIGFKGMLYDQSRAQTDMTFPVREHRVIADLTRSVKLHQQGAVQWSYIRRLSLGMERLTRDVNDFRVKLEAFDLEPGVLYEAIFMSRLRTQPNAQVASDHLNEMGFIAHKLITLQRDARLRDRKNTSVTIWFGLLEWDSTPTVVTEEDPFYFEDLVAV